MERATVQHSLQRSNVVSNVGWSLVGRFLVI